MSVTANERTIWSTRFGFGLLINVRPILNPGYSRRIRLIFFAYHVGIIFALYTCDTIHP